MAVNVLKTVVKLKTDNILYNFHGIWIKIRKLIKVKVKVKFNL